MGKQSVTSPRLLGEAVHRNRAFSKDGLLERMFTFAFRDLVYPLIWEDPRLDLEAMEIGPDSRIVTIASGGCNALSYLAAGPARVHAVDLNGAHVALNRLKHAAFRHARAHDDVLEMFARANSERAVSIYDQLIAPHLDAVSRAYWDGRDGIGRRRISRFARGFYRYGLLGRFIALAHLMARLNGRDPAAMMTARTRSGQIKRFDMELAPIFDRRAVRWLLGHRAALYGLGIPPQQYTALLGGAPHMADVVRERLRKLACDFDLSDNYFAWAAFARRLPADADGPLPPYLLPASFDAIRGSLERISVEHISMTAFLARQAAQSLDRFVLLDAQDWMDDATLVALWSEITRTARPDARVIFRTAGRTTILPGRLPAAILDQWHYEESRSADLGTRDRSAIYGGFHIYRATSNS